MIAHIIPGLLLFVLPYLSYNPYLCVACITISLGLSGVSVITSLKNPHDIAPNYAATIASIANTVATMSGFLAPLLLAYLTRENVSNTIILIKITNFVFILLVFNFDKL